MILDRNIHAFDLPIGQWAYRLLLCVMPFTIGAQNISVFTSVIPTQQTSKLVLPPTHDFQVLAQYGDTLADGTTLKTAPDFSAFVPIYERNDRGYLSLNHEIANLQSGVTVFDLNFDKIHQIWEITNGSAIDFSQVGGLQRACSGTVTPWGTVISGEESILTSDLDSNGYYDAGWLVESRPSDRSFVQKIWKAGNALHENCCIAADQKTVYWGADDPTRGFIFKYVAAQKKQLAAGSLFVLVRDDSTSSTGYWVQVPNALPAQCNNVNAFCQQIGAWNFAGVEDVEIGPYGKIYFAAKYSGRVWRFKDKGPVVSNLEVFVENAQYPIQTSLGTQWTQWGIGADNLAFDNANNLWVLQDGDNSHIWMVKPTHTPLHPQVFLFATTPAGSEPTGITFTPSKRYMFLSFQHPNPWNTDTMTDVSGKRVVFNRGTTIVIARKEFLGSSNQHCPELAVESKVNPLEIKLSPNPISVGMVSLSCKGFDPEASIEVTIFDPIGVICHRKQYPATSQTILLDFNAAHKGNYVIRAIQSGHSAQAILLVQ